MPDISIGPICNNNCVMCIVPEPSKKMQTFSNIKKMVRSVHNPSEIYLTGGEPTLHPDFFSILDYIRKIHPNTQLNIISNGRMFYYLPFVQKLKKYNLNKICIEIHGATPKGHDKITQCRGSFKQTVRGIKNILKTTIPIEVRIVIHKLNYKDLTQISKFISANLRGVNSVVFFPINIVGSAYLNKKKLAITYSQLSPQLRPAIDVLEKNKIPVYLYHIPFCVIEKRYWKCICPRTAPIHKVFFSKDCRNCKLFKTCPGIWKTYATNIGFYELRIIR